MCVTDTAEFGRAKDLLDDVEEVQTTRVTGNVIAGFCTTGSSPQIS